MQYELGAFRLRAVRAVRCCPCCYALLIFVDSSIRNRSLWVGLLSIPASFIQLIGYGTGFLSAAWNRLVLKRRARIRSNEGLDKV